MSPAAPRRKLGEAQRQFIAGLRSHWPKQVPTPHAHQPAQRSKKPEAVQLLRSGFHALLQIPVETSSGVDSYLVI